MNKTELIDAVAARAGLPRAQAAQAAEALFETISRALKKGEKVALMGFGSFAVRKRKARTTRNPKTGKEINIPAGKTPGFKAGKALKEAVN